MAQTLTKLLVHIVYSTKDRTPLIAPKIEPKLYAYIGAICKTNESPLLAANGTQDHVHLLVSLSKNIALADLVMVIKKDSSKWIKTQGAEFARFGWQDGYAGLSIGVSQRKALTGYIARQKERHRKISFQDELRTLLDKYEVEYDERYLWT